MSTMGCASQDDARAVVSVVGAGSIGVAWAVVFARAGLTVRLHDADEDRLNVALTEVRARMEMLESHALLEEPAEDASARVAGVPDLEVAVAGAEHVQECASEQLHVKRDLFAELDRLCPADVVLASSTSAIPASRFAAGLAGAGRCLVAHPANPPYLLPVVELVPSPLTTRETVRRTEQLLSGCGMEPVILRAEVLGFGYNRLQGALLREAYCLVRDGVLSVDDVDRLVRHGLGRRWSVIGPFETADLNTRGGIAAHAALLGPSYQQMGAERGQHDPWTDDLVAEVTAQRRALVPADEWQDRVVWRDLALMDLESARRRSPRLSPPESGGAHQNAGSEGAAP